MRETIFCVCMCVHVYVPLHSSIYSTLKVTLYPGLPETYTSEISSFSNVILLCLIYHIFLKIRSELFPNSSSEKWRESPFNIVLYKYFHQHIPFFFIRFHVSHGANCGLGEEAGLLSDASGFYK